MTEYERGQRDLINHIKSEVLKIEKESKGADVMFDTLLLLKSLKPIKKIEL